MSKLKNRLSQNEMEMRVRPREDDVRGAYYRDTTAIIHSSPFRRLKHKTQVFFAPSNDHICTRIEHVLHVASIADTICVGLGLDSELAWAIGMGHDLGHAPFGHTGENILSRLRIQRGLPVFEHEVHSLRTVEFLARGGKGLNLTYAVRDGIVCHCGEATMKPQIPDFHVKDLSKITERKGLLPSTWEGVVVRFSDLIAYLGRDFEDACRLGIIKKSDLPDNVAATLGTTNGQMIDAMVNDLIEHSKDATGISFSDDIFKAVQELKKFNYERIYRSETLKGYEAYFQRLMKLILEYLEDIFAQYGFDAEKYRKEKNMLAYGFSKYCTEMKERYEEHDGGYDLLVFDYIAGMSDNFCIDCSSEILMPTHLNEDIDRAFQKWFDTEDTKSSPLITVKGTGGTLFDD